MGAAGKEPSLLLPKQPPCAFLGLAALNQSRFPASVVFPNCVKGLSLGPFQALIATIHHRLSLLPPAPLRQEPLPAASSSSGRPSRAASLSYRPRPAAPCCSLGLDGVSDAFFLTKASLLAQKPASFPSGPCPGLLSPWLSFSGQSAGLTQHLPHAPGPWAAQASSFPDWFFPLGPQNFLSARPFFLLPSSSVRSLHLAKERDSHLW